MVEVVVGADVEDFQPAVLVLAHRDLLGRIAQRCLAGPAAVGCDLPVVIDGIVGADVKSFQTPILIAGYAKLLGRASQGRFAAPVLKEATSINHQLTGRAHKHFPAATAGTVP